MTYSRSTRHDILDLTVILLHETPKAWLVTQTGEKSDGVWVPKSQAELEPATIGKAGTLSLPQWLADKAGFQ